jgi:hypothetical protein
MPDIPEGVIVDEDMLGMVLKLKYVDHDITNTVKFPELASHHYFELRTDLTTNESILVPNVWERGLEQEGILNLFDIPHFGRSKKVNARVKFLLTCVHGGYLWLYRPISIDTNLSARITILPTQGQDPNSLFVEKKIDRTLSKEMREKFHTIRGVHGLDVLRICDPTVRLAT